MHIFGMAEGEEGNLVPQFIEKLLRRELPLPQEIDLKIQRAHRSLANKPRPQTPRDQSLSISRSLQPRRRY